MDLSKKCFDFLEVFILSLITNERAQYILLSNFKYHKLKMVCRTMKVYQMWNETLQLDSYTSICSKHYSTSIRSQSHQPIQLKTKRTQAFMKSFLPLILVALGGTVISCAVPPVGAIRSKYSIFVSITPVFASFSKNLI